LFQKEVKKYLGLIIRAKLRKEVRMMAKKVKDFVCGMEFDDDTANGILEYNGKIYYFCSLGCKEKFAREAEKYAAYEEKEGQ
jgi:YHS domain-containing protein